MKNFKTVIVATVLCVCMAFTSSGVYALTKAEQRANIDKKIAQYNAANAELQKKINKLEKEKKAQKDIVDAYQSKINNIQAIIDTYNAEINRINSLIAGNKKKIADKEAEIAADKVEYKKRIRAIYMSEWDSSLKILLDANSFSEYLQLQKLTETVSAKDKIFMEKLGAEIDELNNLISGNVKLLEEQVALRDNIKTQQDALKTEQAKVNKIYNTIAGEQSTVQKEVSQNNKEITQLERDKAALADNIMSQSYSIPTFVNSSSGFAWPVPGYYGISSPFGPRWGRTHYGIDISGGGINGKPFVAISDGVVTIANKSGYGGGYGIYCAINHGTITINGSAAEYVAYYAHATRITVSVGQRVSKGQVIGYVGSTGHSTGPHLHLGIQKNRGWVDPLPLVR